MKISRPVVVVLFLAVLIPFASRSVVNADGPMSSTTEAPVVLSAVAPYYPQIALASRVVGTVVVAVEIDTKGSVNVAKATSGHPLLYKACESTAMRWRFVEADASGGTRRAQLTFVFSFQDDIKVPDVKFDLITFRPPYQVEVSHRLETINNRQTNRP